jgi:phenylacetate-CoA ligase
MFSERAARVREAYAAFIDTPVTNELAAHVEADPVREAIALFQRTASNVPAYASFLKEHGIDPAGVGDLDAFQRLPLTTRKGYLERFPLADRCRDGDLAGCDMIAVSSGSTGEPTFWPRFLTDEIAIARRFEQVFHDSFEADRRRTLAVVCFPLGTWVGGMFTASCCRHLAAKGYPMLVVTPGNNKVEILRVVRSLAPLFEQTVLLGYPPFLKDVVDAGTAEGLRWHDHAVKIVLAGEVFSEEWRGLMAERLGMKQPSRDSASLYGTADAGVLGNETPLSNVIRRFVSGRPDAALALFGQERLPTLVQYDPFSRYFEEHEKTLVFSGENGVPLVRYHISDNGGVHGYRSLIERLHDFGFDAEAETRRHGVRGIHKLPFAYVFGRSHFAVSFYGANVFPDTVSIALEQPETRAGVTGKFVLEVREDAARDQELWIAVERSAAGGPADDELAAAVADAVVRVLLRLNSEFSNYVPAEKRRPKITVWPQGHPEYFPVGVKHRYARK